MLNKKRMRINTLGAPMALPNSDELLEGKGPKDQSSHENSGTLIGKKKIKKIKIKQWHIPLAYELKDSKLKAHRAALALIHGHFSLLTTDVSDAFQHNI